MTSVVLEVAALADALKKANQVAPNRGADFTTMAGIVIDITQDEVVVMARDSEVTFATWLTPDSVDGPDVTWRMPSRVFSEVIGKLKTTMNKTVKLENRGTSVFLTHGRGTRAEFRVMDASDYPRWLPFAPDDMAEVSGIAGVVSALQWAVSKGTDVPHTGVHFDGDLAIATDKYRFASTRFEIDLPEPITIPVGCLTSVLRANEKVRMRVEGKQLYIMPDEFTQMSFTAYGLPYPQIQRVMKRDYPRTVRLSKPALIDAIELTLPMVGSDRSPTIILFFGKEEIAVMLENEQNGKLGSTVDTPGCLDFSPREEVRFNPDNLTAALAACPGTEISLGYDPDKPRGAFYIKAEGTDLEFWVAPRQKMGD